MSTPLCHKIKRLWLFSCCEYFTDIREDVERFLMLNGIENYFFIVTGITEAINNSLVHGKCNDETIKLSVRINDNNKLFVRISHDGIGFNGNRYVHSIRGLEQSILEEKMFDENGRGILMMCVIFDKVIYNQSGNEVLLVKDLTTSIGMDNRDD